MQVQRDAEDQVTCKIVCKKALFQGRRTGEGNLEFLKNCQVFCIEIPQGFRRDLVSGKPYRQLELSVTGSRSLIEKCLFYRRFYGFSNQFPQLGISGSISKGRVPMKARSDHCPIRTGTGCDFFRITASQKQLGDSGSFCLRAEHQGTYHGSVCQGLVDKKKDIDRSWGKKFIIPVLLIVRRRIPRMNSIGVNSSGCHSGDSKVTKMKLFCGSQFCPGSSA